MGSLKGINQEIESIDRFQSYINHIHILKLKANFFLGDYCKLKETKFSKINQL